MTTMLKYSIVTLILGGFLSVVTVLPVNAAVTVQCPGDLNGDADWDDTVDGVPEVQPPNTKCIHLGAGDGYVTMADGKLQYMFGFSTLTGIPTNPAPASPDDAMSKGMLAGAYSYNYGCMYSRPGFKRKPGRKSLLYRV